MIVERIISRKGNLKVSEEIHAQYIHHNGFSRSRPRLPIDMTQLDTFAELLSEGLTVTQAAKRMGFDYSYGNAMLQRIRAKLGPQAI